MRTLVVLIFGAMLVGIEAFIYTFFGEKFLKNPAIDPVRYYGWPYMIFMACFWAVLIAVLAYALYRKAHSL